MNTVFLDTSGLLATVVKDDQWHAYAEPIWLGLIRRKLPLVTTSLILNELGDALCNVAERARTIEFLDRLRNSPRVEIVHVTSELQEQGWQIFRSHHDKEWGITDCVSLASKRHSPATAISNKRASSD